MPRPSSLPPVAASLVLALCVVTVRGQSRQASQAQSRDHDGRGALAILRRDGLLVPFASFDRDTWRVTWPLRVSPTTAVPVSREAIPEEWWGTRTPNQWRAYLPDGSEAFRVQVKVGRLSVRDVEILEGLDPGDRVILSDMSRWENVERVRLK